jgi:hypothetical protein
MRVGGAPLDIERSISGDEETIRMRSPGYHYSFVINFSGIATRLLGSSSSKQQGE